MGLSDGAEMACMLPADMLDTAEGSTDDLSEAYTHGSLPFVTGLSSVVRIPVPGSKGLFVELKPRGFVPASGSTSTLFVQDSTGKKHLRLDYGYNKNTGKIDYHWNQKGTHAKFGIPDHQPAGKSGKVLHQGAKYLRYGGKVLIVVGIAADVYSIVVAKKRTRQIVKVAAGWGGAWAGCKVVGGIGAAGGTLVEPGGGTAVGGIGGCVVGAFGGAWGASWAAEKIYDTVEEFVYEELPVVAD
ncbi:MAG: hypothetical protein ABFS39_12315 [Pseudomonadota bacterium]